MTELKNYQHQEEAIEMCKDLEYSALFMEMGTGKTRVVIKIAEHKYLKGDIDAILLIAPNHVHTQFVTEQMPTHCSVPYTSLIWSSQKKNNVSYVNRMDDLFTPKMDKLKVFAVNVEAFQSDSIVPFIATYVKHNKVFTIIDEATRIKTPKAKRSKTIHKLEKYGQRCILTGTPVTKSPFGLWSMFEFLKHNYFGVNFFIFQARHGVMMQGVNEHTGGRYKTLIDEKTWNITLNKIKAYEEGRGEAGLMFTDFEDVASEMSLSVKNVLFIHKQKAFIKYKRLDELKEAIDSITFYAKKKDCLDLPDKIYETVFLEMGKEHRRVYNTLKSKMLVEYEGKDLTVLNKVALTTRLMQICGGYFPYVEEKDIEIGSNLITIEKKQGMLIGTKNIKLERIKEEFDEMSSFPVIIWAKFVLELENIYKELKKDYKCALYYGKTRTAERETIIEDFKAGEYDILIINPSVGAFGLNLQNATTQFYYSNGFNVEERLQSEDRSHRIGVKGNCLYKDFAFKDSIDEKITRAITTGRDMNEFFSGNTLREILED